MSRTLRLTRSHPRSLLSMPRLKRTSSRTRASICRRTRSAQMSSSLNGAFWPTILPLRPSGCRAPRPDRRPLHRLVAAAKPTAFFAAARNVTSVAGSRLNPTGTTMPSRTWGSRHLCAATRFQLSLPALTRPKTDTTSRHSDAAARPARFVSLRMRLLGLVVLVIVPWLALVLYTQTDERRVAVANVDRDAMRVLELVTSHQEAQIDTARQLLTALARLPQLRTPDTCNALLKEMLGAYPRYTNFVAVDPVGNVTCSAAPMRGPINVSDRAYFQRAMATQRFAVAHVD